MRSVYFVKSVEMRVFLFRVSEHTYNKKTDKKEISRDSSVIIRSFLFVKGLCEASYNSKCLTVWGLCVCVFAFFSRMFGFYYTILTIILNFTHVLHILNILTHLYQ